MNNVLKKVALSFVVVTKLVTMQASSFFLQVNWMLYESRIFFNRAGKKPGPIARGKKIFTWGK